MAGGPLNVRCRLRPERISFERTPAETVSVALRIHPLEQPDRRSCLLENNIPLQEIASAPLQQLARTTSSLRFWMIAARLVSCFMQVI